MSLPEPAQSPPRRLPAGKPQLHQRRSLEQANQVSLQFSGNQVDQSPDPQGQQLRLIRKAQGLDPSRVATEACISLGQLYELETGGRRLFYSETLRQQAGRRVALMLGCDWDALGPTTSTCPTGATSASAPDRAAAAVSINGDTTAPDPRIAPPAQAPAQSVISSPATAASDHGAEGEHNLDHPSSRTPVHKENSESGDEGSARTEQLLRTGVWGLLAVALVLAAARIGWIPGIRLPL